MNVQSTEKRIELKNQRLAHEQALLDILDDWGTSPIGVQFAGKMCPFCSGGESRERSFSVQRSPMAINYKCHRASCGEMGAIPNLATVGEIANARSKMESVAKLQREHDDRVSGYVMVPLPEDIRKFLEQKYHLDGGHIYYGSLMWIANHDRLWLPILEIGTGQLIGGVARTLQKDVKPKIITVLNDITQPAASFYAYEPTKELWIVEDQISALRAGDYVASCALLGCHIQESLIAKLKKHKYTKIVLCLDADAFDKAVALQVKYGALFDEFEVRRPVKDLKDMSTAELANFILRK